MGIHRLHDGPGDAIDPRLQHPEPAGVVEDRDDLATTLLTHTPVGPLRITATRNGIRTLTFLDGPDDLPREFSHSGRDGHRAKLHLTQAVATLRGYFAGVCESWRIPLDLEGLSDFQLRVLDLLQTIPLGEVRSYIDLAEEVGGPSNARAVGRAVGSNPIPILIPCHRVIRNDGRLGGFLGGLVRKAELLRLEGVDVEDTAASSRVVPGGLRLDL